MKKKISWLRLLVFSAGRATISVVSSCKSDDADKLSSRFSMTQRGLPCARVLQAACHVPDFYHRRVQRRTSAGRARYSTASGTQRRAIRVEPWNVSDFSGASSRW